MQRVCWLVMMLMLPSVAVAQDIKPDDLRKLYNSTLTELKAAQDRKAELATDNARLAARVSDLEKQLAIKSQQMDQLNTAAVEMADRTVLLRSHYSAWQEFMAANPSVAQQWEYFLDADASEGSLSLLQSSWPLEPQPAPAVAQPVEEKHETPVIQNTATTKMATTLPSVVTTRTAPAEVEQPSATTRKIGPIKLPPAVDHYIINGTATRESSATRPSTASKP